MGTRYEFGRYYFGIIGAVIVLIVPATMIWVGIYANIREKSYMKEQRQTGRDKQRMLDFMQIVMKEYGAGVEPDNRAGYGSGGEGHQALV